MVFPVNGRRGDATMERARSCSAAFRTVLGGVTAPIAGRNCKGLLNRYGATAPTRTAASASSRSLRPALRGRRRCAHIQQQRSGQERGQGDYRRVALLGAGATAPGRVRRTRHVDYHPPHGETGQRSRGTSPPAIPSAPLRRGRRSATGEAAGQRCCFTVEEAADCLGIGRTYMFDLIMSGVVPSVRIGNLRRVRPQELERYVASLSRVSGDEDQ